MHFIFSSLNAKFIKFELTYYQAAKEHHHNIVLDPHEALHFQIMLFLRIYVSLSLESSNKPTKYQSNIADIHIMLNNVNRNQYFVIHTLRSIHKSLLKFNKASLALEDYLRIDVYFITIHIAEANCVQLQQMQIRNNFSV